jgi:uncharacterized membrane protein
MSDVSQKPAMRRPGFLPWFAVSMLVGFTIIAAALGPQSWGPIARMAASATPHLPNMNVWNALSPVVHVHVLTAVAALILGAVLMLVRKGRIFHRVAGWVWVSIVAVTAGSTLFITSLNNGTWSLLHLFTGWTLLTLPLAVFAAKRHVVAKHRRAMMGLFYGGFAINFFIAFIPGRAMWVMFFG